MQRDEAVRLLELAREAHAHLYGGEWADRAEREHEGLLAAIDWFRSSGDIEHALELAYYLRPFWLISGRSTEGRALLTELLAAPEAQARTLARARAAFGAGEFAFRAGENDEARALYEEAIAVADDQEDWDLKVRALVGLARAAFRDRDTERVRRLGEEAQQIAREHGDRAAEWTPIHMQAAAARMAGDRPRAWELYGQTLELARELGSRQREVVELGNMGWIALHDGDLERAETLFRQFAEGVLELKDAYLFPYAALAFGAVASAEARPADATRLVAAAAARFEADGVVPDPDDQDEYERLVVQLRKELGDAEFDRVWAEGQTLDVERAVADTIAAVA